MKRTKQNDDNFIMLPTVDFCFKELMRNPKVRKGFIAAVLGKKPEEIRDMTLIPTGRKVKTTSLGSWMSWWNLKMRQR